MGRPAVAFVVQDLLFCLVLCLVCGGAAGLVALAHPYLLGQLAMPWPVVLWPLYYLLFIAGLCAMVLAIRLLTGRLQPGAFPFPGHPNCKRWMLHMAMLRILRIPAWRFLVYGITGLRFFALRALGCRNAFACDASADATVLDAGLHRIGPGSMLASAVTLTGHFMKDGKLRLGAIVIGKDTLLLAGASLGPSCELGDNVIIGPMNRLFGGLRVESGARTGLDCTMRVGVHVGRDAVLEDGVYLQANVHVGDGARVLAHTMVPAGTQIAAGSTYPADAASSAPPTASAS